MSDSRLLFSLSQDYSGRARGKFSGNQVVWQSVIKLRMRSQESGVGSMPTLVFLHGMGTGANAWQPQTASFQEDYRVLAPFLPSYASQPGPFTLHRAVEMVVALLLTDNVPTPAHVCGRSLGALVAMEPARLHPELVRTLALSAGSITIPDELQAAREASA